MTRNGIFHVMLMTIFIFSLKAFADTSDSSIKVGWGYKGNIGPERWSQLDPSFALCARGKWQAPINIIKKVQKASYTLSLHYQPSPMEIVEDGTSELTIGTTHTIIHDGHSVQINFASNLEQSITFNGKKYQLVQLHTHSPSENEWHNQTFPLELHFVHQGENGQLIVMGVFVQSGAANPTLQKMIDHLPREIGKVEEIKNESIDPNSLIPEKQNYYSFVGSLTTPPCSEGVQWIVMSDPITASPSQILLLRKASGGGNARPVQPLNKRTIYYSTKI